MPEALTQAPSKKTPGKATAAKKAPTTAKKAAAKAATEAKPARKAAPAVAKTPVKKPATPKTKTSKAVAAKSSSTTKAVAQGKGETVITPEQRYRMICDAAYFRAERRGFVGGNPMEDWLAAEAEIDALLRSMQQ